MIRTDFQNGGFPIGNRNPVLCVTSDGNVLVAYNNTQLKAAKELNKTIIKMIGVWPGRKDTDLFTMSVDQYGIMAPPDGHAAVDNAEKITVERSKKTGAFVSATYVVDGLEVICRDPDMGTYLEASGKPCVVKVS